MNRPNTIDVVAGKAATANIKLKPTKNLSAQLTDDEWQMSIPGTDEQENFLLGRNSCHTIERIVEANRYIRRNREGSIRFMMEWIKTNREMAVTNYGAAERLYNEDGSASEVELRLIVGGAKKIAQVNREVVLSDIEDISILRAVQR